MWKAFDRLSTTRPRGTGSVGPISYREVFNYAEELEIGPGLGEFLWEVIRKVDAAFLGFLNNKMQADRRQIEAKTNRQKELPRG